MDGTVKLIEDIIRGWERGRIFFPQDFTALFDHDSVRQALCSLTDDGTIVRLARGVYCYPRIEWEYAMKVILPSEETIAEAVARKENVRIIPYGDEAARRLGLSPLRVSTLKYLTDGSPRVINLSQGRRIHFNHTSEVKMFAFRNTTMQMAASAIRALWKDYLENDEEKKRILRKVLHSVPEKDFLNDITLPPAWVGEIMMELWNG